MAEEANGPEEEALAPEPEAANSYRFSNADTQISYSTESIQGDVPRFSYTGPRGEFSFSGGEQITTLGSELGTEVTVQLEFVSDGDAVSLTILLPDVSRLRFGEQFRFQTLGIITTNAGGFAGPPPGARKSYEVITLDGEASILLF